MQTLLPLFILAFTTAAYASETLSEYRFTKKSDAVVRTVAEQFEIIARSGDEFTVLVPLQHTSDFLSLVPDATLLALDANAFLKSFGPVEARGYHDFQSVKKHLDRIAFAHPQWAKTFQYGTSQDGRPLMGLKISDAAEQQEAEPEIMFTSATHGDELITVEVLMGLLDKIAEGYEKADPRMVRIVEGLQIYFLPVINPDGYVNKTRYANGVDPNRDYPWPEKPNRTPNPCIRDVIQFFHSHDFKGSIDFHASGGMIMYPWAYTDQPIPSTDANIFETLTRKMASFNHYVFGPIAEVIYVAKGSSADYYYWKNKTLALGIEVGTSKAPNVSQIPKYIDENYESTLSFLEHF